ncbi:MAG: hypothetical protein NW206_03330 [Hyphomonadaceae bacterium]|nr:hypothetical protein [Hyphomonadaceae bacterium]
MLHRSLFAAALFALCANASAQTVPDPDRMSRQALEDEVRALRPLIQNGGVQPNRPEGCLAPEHRQLDFWIGEWDVSPTGSENMSVAESTIRPLDQGCSIFEEWRPFQGPSGHSLSDYDPTTQQWHQTWIDAAGTRTLFTGAFENGVMALDYDTPPPAGQPPSQRRMSYQQLDTNTVRQWGARLNETTQSWDVIWDYTYKRRAGTAR